MIILETDRLQLREMTPDDLNDLYEILSDPIAMQHYPTPYDREGVQDWIQRALQSYEEKGFGLWAVIHKKDARFIGDCGLTIQQVDGVGELEIGYHISREYWGQGVATEAARACRDYVFDVLKRDRVISWMNPKNLASRKVAEKNGMRLEKESTDRYGRPAVVYSMTPADRQ